MRRQRTSSLKATPGGSRIGRAPPQPEASLKQQHTVIRDAAAQAAVAAAAASYLDDNGGLGARLQ